MTSSLEPTKSPRASKGCRLAGLIAALWLTAPAAHSFAVGDDPASLAAMLRSVLTQEIASLKEQQDQVDAASRAALEASRQWRAVAVILLSAPLTDMPPFRDAPLEALVMFEARHQLDALAGSIARPAAHVTPEAASLAREQIAAFVERIRTIDAAALTMDRRHQLATLLEPLVRAHEAVSRGPVEVHWVRCDQVDRGVARRFASEMTIGCELLQRIHRIAVEAEELDDLQELAAAVRAITDYLARGIAFAEFRPAIVAYVYDIERAIDAASMLPGIAARDPELADHFRHSLRMAAEAFLDPARRDGSQVMLGRLTAQINALRRIEEVRDVDRDAAPLAAAARVVVLDLESAAGQAALAELRRAAELLRDAAMLDGQRVRPEFGGVLDRAKRRHAEAENRAIEAVQEFAAEQREDVLRPAVNDLDEALRDLRRIAQIESLVAAMERVNPGSGGSFRQVLRRAAPGLFDAIRRPETNELFDAAEQELMAFKSLPFERELRADPVLAAAATGASPEKLLSEITRLRRQWAEAWSRGAPDPDLAAGLLLLHRLGEAMESLAVANLISREGDVQGLHEWAMWRLPSRVTRRAASDASSRVKLAVHAAIRGRSDLLALELARLEDDLPLALIVGHLNRALRSVDGTFNDGFGAALAWLTAEPPADAWLLEARDSLDELATVALSGQYWRERDDEPAAELASDLRDLAAQLSARLIATAGGSDRQSRSDEQPQLP